jgi:Glycosyltransferase 61
MKRMIAVNLPANVTDYEKHIFEPFMKYELVSLKIKKVRNALVTFSGLCLDQKGLIKESHHSNPKQFEDFLREAFSYCHNLIKNPENCINLENDNVYLVIHHPWYNYYHWLCECIFRLWMIKDHLAEMILVLPDYYESTDFIMGSLKPFNLKKIFFIPRPKSLYVKNLCLPQIKPVVDSYDPKAVKEIREFYLNYVLNEKKIHIDLGERVYISRSKASRKKVQNEEELKEILKKYKFVILNNEDYSFLEQVSIYSNVKYLISIHGSGLTNMLFMKENSNIFELLKKKTNIKDWHSPVFWYLADCLGYAYFQQICDPTDLDAGYFNSDLIVDTEQFEKNISLMF